MVSTQDVPNPYNPVDLGTETTTFDRKSANIHFSIGITAYLNKTLKYYRWAFFSPSKLFSQNLFLFFLRGKSLF